MIVKQNLSILFYHKKKKSRIADSKAPIYVRVTIDGLDDEISTGIYVHPDHWENDTKTISSGDAAFKKLNKELRQIQTDLERHFDRVQATHEVATPTLVFQAYRTPLNGERQKQEKVQNLELSELLDTTIKTYLGYSKKYQKAHDTSHAIAPEKTLLLKQEHERLTEIIEGVAKNTKGIFNNKQHVKTLMLTVDEHLLNFLELVCAGHRSPNSLEKMWGRKKRVIEFLQYNFQAIDIPLATLQYNFIEQYNKFNLVQKKTEPNTAMKYCQSIKEVIDRAVANEWMNTNIFSIFSCSYIDPKHDWLTWQEMNTLIGWRFAEEKFNVVRDIIVFCSFTGLSYQEVYSLSPADIITGIDGKRWISKERQKTDGDESLPLLPIAEQLLEKYKDHPKCLQKGRLLPVPTNQEFNRCCKEITRQTGIAIDMRSHKNRYFFANEVTYNQGVPLKTVSKMLSHKSIKTTEIYVRANRQNISENMNEVQRKLFTQNGELKVGVTQEPQQAKVITLRVV